MNSPTASRFAAIAALAVLTLCRTVHAAPPPPSSPQPASPDALLPAQAGTPVDANGPAIRVAPDQRQALAAGVGGAIGAAAGLAGLIALATHGDTVLEATPAVLWVPAIGGALLLPASGAAVGAAIGAAAADDGAGVGSATAGAAIGTAIGVPVGVVSAIVFAGAGATLGIAGSFGRNVGQPNFIVDGASVAFMVAAWAALPAWTIIGAASGGAVGAVADHGETFSTLMRGQE